MSKSGSTPAFPGKWMNPDSEFADFQTVPGVTKRELFAAMIMQGIVSTMDEDESPQTAARCSTVLADALLTELEKTNA